MDNKTNNDNNKRYDVGDNRSMKKLTEVLKSSKNRLSIARIDKGTRDDFIKLATDRFCEDYGMTLQWVLYQALEYQVMKEKMIDLGSMNERLLSVEEAVTMLQSNTSTSDVIKTLGGTIIQKNK